MDDTLFIEIQRLCRIVHQRGLRELAISRPEFSISVTAMPTGVSAVPVAAPTAVSALPVSAAAEPAEAVPTGYQVISPLIGIFYRTPSPDAPPFVEIGDVVEVGQTVGIVEAMKVFNEITTEQAGTVIAIPAENGALVHVDQPLVIIEPSA